MSHLSSLFILLLSLLCITYVHAYTGYVEEPPQCPPGQNVVNCERDPCYQGIPCKLGCLRVPCGTCQKLCTCLDDQHCQDNYYCDKKTNTCVQQLEEEEECPPDRPKQNCRFDPCQTVNCPQSCRSSYCGVCTAECIDKPRHYRLPVKKVHKFEEEEKYQDEL